MFNRIVGTCAAVALVMVAEFMVAESAMCSPQVAEWIDPEGGDWYDSQNWIGSPGFGVRTVFDIGNADYIVSTTDDMFTSLLEVGTDGVLFNLGGTGMAVVANGKYLGEIRLSREAGHDADVTFTNGQVNVDGGVYIAEAGDSSAVLTLIAVAQAGLTQLDCGPLEVGTGGNGLLAILGSTTVQCQFSTTAATLGSTGFVDVDSGSFNAATNHVIGAVGDGTVLLRAGGTAFCDFVNIGFVEGSIGTLQIQSGGVFQQDPASGTGCSMATFGGAGFLIVEDPGSLFDANFLHIGERGPATVTISNGGVIDLTFGGSLGTEKGAIGDVTVTGTGSKLLTTAGSLVVGNGGTGHLAIGAGGQVLLGEALSIGQAVDVSGEVVVSGSGSLLTAGFTAVGSFGTGTLLAQGGGDVALSGPLYVGDLVDSQGAITLSGAGTTMTVDSFVQNGQSGTGSIQVLDGATFHSTDTHFISNVAQGSVSVSGPGSLLSTDAQLQVGSVQYGLLTIENGGQVTAPSGVVGVFAPTGAGDITVTGPGSTWTSSDFVAGYDGPGAITLWDGGTLEVTSALFVGLLAGGDGNVDLHASSATVAGNIYVGLDGLGSIFATDTSLVTAGDTVFIGVNPTGEGIIVLEAGSTLLSPFLVIGDQGTGTFGVNGGFFSNDGTTVGNNGTGTLAMFVDSTSEFGPITVGVNAPGFVELNDSAVLFGSGQMTLGAGGVAETTLRNSSHAICTSLVTGVASPSTLSVAATAQLTASGTIEQGPFGSMLLQVDGVQAPISTTGVLIPGGLLNVTFVDGFVPQAGNVIPIIAADDVDGAFDAAIIPTMPEGLEAELVLGPGGVTIEVLESSGGGVVLEPPVKFDVVGTPTVEDVGNLDTAVGASAGVQTQDVVVVIPGEPGGTGAVQVFRNEGNDETGEIWLGFTANEPITVGDSPSGVTVGEFNGDMFLDMAVSNEGDDTVIVLLNTGNGDGTFDPQPPIGVGAGPTTIANGDITEDGTIDLIVANGLDGTVQVLQGNGSGGFTPLAATSVGIDPQSIDPEDLDNDRCLDLMVANAVSGTVTVLMNQKGTLVVVDEITVGNGPIDLASGDLDNDGDIDFATANNGDDSVTLLVNDGNGAFTAVPALAVGAAPTSVDAVDLNGDLALDLAVVADDPVIGPSVQVLTNLGDLLAFEEPIAFSVDADPQFVVGVDLNNDGLADLVTANAEQVEDGSVSALISVPTVFLCSGDENGDGEVNVEDLVIVIVNWGDCPLPPDDCPGDVNDDGAVDVQDLVEVVLGWGGC